MNRRKFLQTIGLAPVATVTAMKSAESVKVPEVTSPNLAELQREIESYRHMMIERFKRAETKKVDPSSGAPLYDARNLDSKTVWAMEERLIFLEKQYQEARLAALIAQGAGA